MLSDLHVLNLLSAFRIKSIHSSASRSLPCTVYIIAMAYFLTFLHLCFSTLKR